MGAVAVKKAIQNYKYSIRERIFQIPDVDVSDFLNAMEALGHSRNTISGYIQIKKGKAKEIPYKVLKDIRDFFNKKYEKIGKIGFSEGSSHYEQIDLDDLYNEDV